MKCARAILTTGCITLEVMHPFLLSARMRCMGWGYLRRASLQVKGQQLTTCGGGGRTFELELVKGRKSSI